MKYDPKIHHRRSIRLRGYDYSQGGAYFITICTQNRRCVFGHIADRKMNLNEFGQIAHREWEKLPQRWPHLELGAFQIMPNHMHGILLVRAPLAGAPDAPHSPVRAPLAGAPSGPGAPSGADNLPVDGGREEGATARVAPTVDAPTVDAPTVDAPTVDAPTVDVPTVDAPTVDAPAVDAPAADAPTQIQWARKPTVGQIVGAYKSMVVTECLKYVGANNPGLELGKLWQRNFWENVIRNSKAFDRITNYIIQNPANWKKDKFFNRK